MDAKPLFQPLREALRSYLGRYPEAADSLEGIRRWWLPDAMRGTPIERLRTVLEELVEAGEMCASTLPDGTRLYARGEGDRLGGDGGIDRESG